MLRPVPDPHPSPAPAERMLDHNLLEAAARQARHVDESLVDLAAVSRALRSSLTQAAEEPLGEHAYLEQLAVLEGEVAALTGQLADIRTLVRIARGA